MKAETQRLSTRPAPSAPSLAEIRLAARTIAPFIRRTALAPLNANPVSRSIFLKLENLQDLGVFKIRPVANLLLNTPADKLQQGVYTASSGNGGLALAWMARELSIVARVYAPEGSPEIKLNTIRRLGAEVCLLAEPDWWQIILDQGAPGDPGYYVDAVRNPLALAGNATLGLEIAEQLPGLETVIVPYGGGGVACGVAAALRILQPKVRIVAAECEVATPLTAALAAGEPTPVEVRPSFITGAGAPIVLNEMWPLASSLVKETCVVSLEQVAGAIRHLAEFNHVVAEGAGAIAVAAALELGQDAGRTACVVTGGNLDLPLLARLLQT
ncbi:MAG TPA: pyridoxal-phosphate dependent enzyme [Xanthomonadales bacterium]|nr:pyridoxal-phosphate dependent enzyme [Xanthomonadales bacterium]